MSPIKPRFNPPTRKSRTSKQLIIRHPHYDEFNTLLKLPALSEGDTVDYDTALILCGIVSANSYASVPFEAGEVFYFASQDKTFKYPVCRTWDEWCPPSTEDELPSSFVSFTIPKPPPSLPNGGYMDDLKSRDVSCRVMGLNDGCGQAHLVPETEQDWWDKNMAGRSGFGIQSAQNEMLLLADLHRLFDMGAWVPMVKENKMVVHVLRNSLVSSQFIEKLHDRAMQQMIGIDKICLFVRIAYSVFPLLSEFVAARRLANENTLFKLGSDVKELSPKDCDTFKAKPRSRKGSPTKRFRLEPTKRYNSVVKDEYWESMNDDDDYSFRGRKRRRS